ncbi:alpha/beta hydrolase [Microbacterium elymi]|uniref:alpha/beta hydrolase n=1 Tax=Microbacterium elymi TaxID=2909587 RepID=UPI003F4955AE
MRLRDARQAVPAGLVAVYPAMHPNGQQPDELFAADDPFRYVPLNYAGSVEALRDPVAFPGMGSMQGFPRSFVVVCENDFLRPSVERFVTQLQDAGVPVERWFEPDAMHGHLNDPSHPEAVRTLAGLAEWIGAGSDR